MSRRVWIISGSLVVHAGVAIGLFAHGVWKIDQLEPGRADVSLAVPLAVLPPPAASGAPSNAQIPVSRPKRVAKEPTQPKVKLTFTKVALPATGGGDTTGSGPGGPGGDKGSCLVEPCGPIATIPEIPLPPADPLPEIKIPKPPIQTPDMMEKSFISGVRQIAPSNETRQEMNRADKRHVKATFKVCIDTAGGATPTLLKSTGFPAYDATLIEGIRRWRYRPLTVDGKPVPSCGPVHFHYTMQ